MDEFRYRYTGSAELWRAGNALLLRGRRARHALVVLCFSLLALLGLTGDQPIMVACVATAAFLYVYLHILVYAHARRGLTWSLAHVGERELVLDDRGLHLVGANEQTFRSWGYVRELWAGRDAWLVFTHDVAVPVILPGGAFAGDAGAFARERARSAGGRVIEP